MTTFVLWKDHYGFNEENGLEKACLFRRLWQHSMNSVQEVMPA